MINIKQKLKTSNVTHGTNTHQYIVVHHTAGGSIESNIKALTQDKSCHYLIDANGDIYKIGEDTDILWHAGYSSWGNLENMNSYSIGIEVRGPIDNGFTDQQRKAVSDLVVDLMTKYNIPKENILRHKDIAVYNIDHPEKYLKDATITSILDRNTKNSELYKLTKDAFVNNQNRQLNQVPETGGHYGPAYYYRKSDIADIYWNGQPYTKFGSIKTGNCASWVDYQNTLGEIVNNLKNVSAALSSVPSSQPSAPTSPQIVPTPVSNPIPTSTPTPTPIPTSIPTPIPTSTPTSISLTTQTSTSISGIEQWIIDIKKEMTDKGIKTDPDKTLGSIELFRLLRIIEKFMLIEVPENETDDQWKQRVITTAKSKNILSDLLAPCTSVELYKIIRIIEKYLSEEPIVNTDDSWIEETKQDMIAKGVKTDANTIIGTIEIYRFLKILEKYFD